MTGMRRATVAVAAAAVLSGLAGAAAGCAGGSGSSAAGGGGGAPAAKQSLAPVDGQALGASAAPQGAASLFGSEGSARTAAGHSVGVRADVSVPVPSAVIKTASLDLRVAHGKFGDAMNAATDVALHFGGYVSRSTSFGTKVHDGTIVMRVPAGRFDPARVAVERLGRATNEVVSGRDVTRQVVNLGARLGNLESQQRALRALMRRAVSVSDTIRVQGVLQGVELQIEEIQGELNYLHDRTSMSTISIAVHEAGRRPVPPQHASAIWKDGARAAHGATEVVGAVIVGAGYVIPLAILALLAVLVGRLAAPWAAPLAARRRTPAATPPDD
ncbi:MAG TPA: DUF4349 domain-containing protein [Gaiellales bacterium]|nr:DUF4349 domain-containing protein [Gaiellales bacterium]